jgi:hypothetical protein
MTTGAIADADGVEIFRPIGIIDAVLEVLKKMANWPGSMRPRDWIEPITVAAVIPH